MTADLIIPTYRPDDTFCLLLHQLREQTFVVNRVILLNTEEALWEESKQKYPLEKALSALPCDYTLIHVKKREFDHGGTRMLGADASEADVMIFMTQDAVPYDAFLMERLLAPFMAEGEQERAAAVSYARQLANKNCSPAERYIRQFNYPETGMRKTKEDIPRLGIKTYFCSDVCAAYRKDIFRKLGGFESPVIFNEDMFYAAKAVNAGYAVVYAADALVVHSHNYTVKQQFRRNFDLAVSQAGHPEIFEQVSSEAEGMKLVVSTAKHLVKSGKPHLVFGLFLQCAGRYAGFFLGKRYRRLSRKQILKCSMSPDYWARLWEQES